MKFGGGGGMKDLEKMMKQAQKLQNEMLSKQGELEGKEYEGSAGGVVKAVVSGKFELRKITIDPAAVDPDDVSELEEMVQMAVNSAIQAARDEQESLMKSLTSGMPGFGF